MMYKTWKIHKKTYYAIHWKWSWSDVFAAKQMEAIYWYANKWIKSCFTREKECCGYEEGEKEQKTVKFGQQERKRVFNLRFVKDIFLLWWDNEKKAIVYVHLTIKIIEHTLKFRNIYNDWWYCHLNTTVFFFLAANRKKSSSILHQGLKSISPMIQKRCL